jgi:hypothetical protein
MTAFLTVLLGLGVPGLLPALAVARRSPVVILLAPVIGAVFAALAAELELGIAGSLVAWYVLIAVVVNLAVIGWWLVARRSGSVLVLARSEPALTAARQPDQAPPRSRFPAWGWYVITVAVLVAALAVPLTALRSHVIYWDSNSIWLTHALMISGGHHELLTSLQNHTYTFSNPDYPPLVPAAGALAFKFFGMGSLLIAIDTTVFVTACALGVAGAGIVAAAGDGSPLTRATAIVTAGAVCIAAFAVAGKYGIDGNADLMWAAAAVAAIIWGLVLPRSTQALVIAWICAIAASLTKNEGLATALIVLALIALRYRPIRLPRVTAWAAPLYRLTSRLNKRAALLNKGAAHVNGRAASPPPLARWAREWAQRAAFVLVPAAPGLGWAGLVHLDGIQNVFFQGPSGQSLASRAAATVEGMGGQLKIAPVALLMLVAGSLVLRRYRESARLANPAWLWLSCLGSLAVIFATYLFGSDPIQVWLHSSVNRTTIFAQVLLIADVAIWLVIAVSGAFGPSIGPARATADPAAEPGAAGDTQAAAAPSPAARL